MVVCKKCHSTSVVKNGFVRGKQRFRCNQCGLNFVEGDERTNDKIAVKKALCVLLYSLGKVSFNMLAKIFNTWPSLTYRWVAESGAKRPEHNAVQEVQEMQFDDMVNYVAAQKEKTSPNTPVTLAHGNLWPGYSAIVILLPSETSTSRKNS